jgi:DNA-binding response OmpR family regulator
MMSDTAITLAVDDEAGIRYFIQEALQPLGYNVVTASDGSEALQQLRDTHFDLVLLDLKLGGRVNGMRVLEAIRWRWPNTAVVILTAHGTMQSALEAIREGVDGYLLKPVEAQELRQAVQDAISRRSLLNSRQSHPQVSLKRGPFSVDLERRVVERDGQALDLTPQEFKLLVYFLENAGSVIAPGELAEVVRHDKPDNLKEARQIIRWHVHRLRQKVEPIPEQPRYILNVRGVGYTLEV